MCYSPVRYVLINIQLACVKYAASVHPEPGSNSLFLQIYILIKSLNLKKNFYLNDVVF